MIGVLIYLNTAKHLKPNEEFVKLLHIIHKFASEINIPMLQIVAHRSRICHFPRLNGSQLSRLPPVRPQNSISWDHLKTIASKMKSWYLALSLLLLAASTIQPTDARGGRGRGGGSFGGLFGGWRKYKKPSSSGGGRRVVSGSPVHTAMTVPKPPPPPPAPPKMPMMPPKQQIPSYPRQQMPPGYGFGSYPGQGSGTYYANAQALPAGAVYYAQPPVGMNRGIGEYLDIKSFDLNSIGKLEKAKDH